jgi:hypothetical protein
MQQTPTHEQAPPWCRCSYCGQQRARQWMSSWLRGPLQLIGQSARSCVAPARKGRIPQRVQRCESIAKTHQGHSIMTDRFSCVQKTAKARRARLLVRPTSRSNRSSLPTLLAHVPEQLPPSTTFRTLWHLPSTELALCRCAYCLQEGNQSETRGCLTSIVCIVLTNRSPASKSISVLCEF